MHGQRQAGACLLAGRPDRPGCLMADLLRPALTPAGPSIHAGCNAGGGAFLLFFRISQLSFRCFTPINFCHEIAGRQPAINIDSFLQPKRASIPPTHLFSSTVFRFLSLVRENSPWALFVPIKKVPKPKELFSLSRDGLTNP